MDDDKHEIKIQVRTKYIANQSQPENGRFVFGYTITIENSGSRAARLVSRHWVITDANGKVQEVTGDGVVGEQPHLGPGDVFRYSSGAVIDTPVGSMQGSYRMQTDDGFGFDAPIAPFTLAVPGLLH
jgi:ApaG protein